MNSCQAVTGEGTRIHDMLHVQNWDICGRESRRGNILNGGRTTVIHEDVGNLAATGDAACHSHASLATSASLHVERPCKHARSATPLRLVSAQQKKETRCDGLVGCEPSDAATLMLETKSTKGLAASDAEQIIKSSVPRLQRLGQERLHTMLLCSVYGSTSKTICIRWPESYTDLTT